MNGMELAVLIGGAFVIGLLGWFFFGPKEAARAASAPQEGGAGGPRPRGHDLRGLRLAR